MWPVLGAGAAKRSRAPLPEDTVADAQLPPPPPPKRAMLVAPLEQLPDNVVSIVEAFASTRIQMPQFRAFEAKYGNRIPATYHGELGLSGWHPGLPHANLR